MGVQLDWQVRNEDGEWETVVTAFKRPRRKSRAWVWAVLVAAFAASAFGGWSAVQRRYRDAHRQIAFQIQTVIDLEAQALERWDLDAFLDQQDESSPYGSRPRPACTTPRCLHSGIRTLGCYFVPSPDAWRKGCIHVHRPRVENVELRGDVAWVEVIVGQPPMRRVHFYRQTSLGWKHTAPRAEFWREPLELERGKVCVRYHQRDLPYVQPLADHVSTVYKKVCSALDCPLNGTLEVEFTPEVSSAQLGVRVGTRRTELVLPSPWLSGIPVDGTWDRAYLDELSCWVSHAIQAQILFYSMSDLS